MAPSLDTRVPFRGNGFFTTLSRLRRLPCEPAGSRRAVPSGDRSRPRRRLGSADATGVRRSGLALGTWLRTPRAVGTSQRLGGQTFAGVGDFGWKGATGFIDGEHAA